MTHDETTDFHGSSADDNFPGGSQMDDDPILMGEVSRSTESTIPVRKSGGGLMSVLGMLVPVVLGGVTVFGVYFLFLEDLLNKPPANIPADPVSKTSQEPSKQSPEVPFRPPRQSIGLQEPIAQEPEPETASPETNEPAATANTQLDPEEAAENALKLAQKMGSNNPSAAEKWFRKVIERFPETKAAKEAEAWLKKQAGEP